jgi:phosphatidate cytidylyltransferase
MRSRTLKPQTEWTEEPKFSSILDSESEVEFIRDEQQNQQQELTTVPPLTKGDMITRIRAGIGMVCAFCFLFYLGFLPVAAFILMLQFLIFKELIAIAHSPSQERKLPWFRSLTWFFLICTTYHLYGEAVFLFISNSISNRKISNVVLLLREHHNFISFLLHSLGIVAFVLNLKRGHYRFQFRQLGFALIVLLVAFYQTKCFYNLLFQGKFWIILPSSLVIVNDSIAYFCGKAFGRTLLMKISPKKTVEGFVGGFIGTLIWAFLVRIFFHSDSF